MEASRHLQAADRVVLEWTRWTRSGVGEMDTANVEANDKTESSEAAETELWRNVHWVRQGERDDWFIYEGKDDPHNRDELANEIKTVLHVKGNVLTWIRRGAAEWRHQFEAGKQFTSILQTGPLTLDVMTDTHSLDVSMASDQGLIKMDYSLNLSGELQRVQTQIRFFKEGLYEHQESLGGRG
ncbi:DUF1934 domain-containing protein [Alicyclobacillus sp. SO9]|uniref:DUF1934 domain-containing protein n=1 Tax=Alicyclobacillus sp. SO9 TaxID=2665646 RepID=UPI0018E86431|nr:DUF1934 domain-containing protein [Alicyclobacillus sp. SO9]QQE78878.1 DUF1934 domain-containing protein [Alicyclobacillus sp. SO9]